HTRNHARPCAFDTWLRGLTLTPPQPSRGHGGHQLAAAIMKLKLFAGHHEAGQALVLSIAGVTAIMLVASLVLKSGIEAQSPTQRYAKEKGHQQLVAEVDRWRPRPLPARAAPNGSQIGRCPLASQDR